MKPAPQGKSPRGDAHADPVHKGYQEGTNELNAQTIRMYININTTSFHEKTG